ncbi:YjjG family noncanonical pyrimidine nucleotidase [Sphaerochaeta globosa]|uniref:HAD superfamily (Subfamily IA) hydrolase, TIGR02254 n=1 Tax=Sphaerochaeta globosa (strain ATCC BAA-1886 / DSM 22777 / Buddy) TaxID=158189 RepID=F0RSI4_SPHGB|nr:YjjG family noncanonical pyrimidine nucleotidase [Sphaerochaeta globosa]ADY14097.1 HAD superfamily (subfamily IA) hydrolase, TIGR02254 [Sphaerochaeta globosa str. Buddy]
MYRYLFFDADGTLFDFEQAEFQAFHLMAKEMGLSIQSKHFLQYKACNASCWKEFERGELTLEELKTKRFERFCEATLFRLDPHDASQRYQNHLARQGILFAHSKNILSSLTQRGYTLFIATNGIADVQWGRFKQSGITHFFQDIFISEELGYQKPDTRYFSAMLERTHLTDKKQQCLMIGDSLASDIQGALDSGIDALWYNPHNLALPPHLKTTYTVNRLEEILGLLTNPI